MKWPGVELKEGRCMIRRAKERFEKEEKHRVLRSDSYISLTHSLLLTNTSHRTWCNPSEYHYYSRAR